MCSICLQPIQTTEITKNLICRHQFHAPCFDVWSNNNTDYVSCPMCRKVYKKKYKYCNPPHFVLVRPKPKMFKGFNSTFLIPTLIVMSICYIIISIFDQDKRNANWGITKLWCCAFFIFSSIQIIILIYKRLYP
jgi:hypothetical protein